MKYTLLILAFTLFLFSCHKEKSRTPTVQDVANIIGLKFNTPYKLTVFQNGKSDIYDTITFINIAGTYIDSIREVYNGISYTYYSDTEPILDSLGAYRQYGAKDGWMIRCDPLYNTKDPSVLSPYYKNGLNGIFAIFTAGIVCQNNKPTLGIYVNYDKNSATYTYCTLTAL